jgi:hypothetical protein
MLSFQPFDSRARKLPVHPTAIELERVSVCCVLLPFLLLLQLMAQDPDRFQDDDEYEGEEEEGEEGMADGTAAAAGAAAGQSIGNGHAS